MGIFHVSIILLLLVLSISGFLANKFSKPNIQSHLINENINYGSSKFNQGTIERKILTRSYPRSFGEESGHTAWIDSVLGSDTSGQLQDIDNPYASFSAAIDAIKALNTSDTWTLFVRTGIYNEVVDLPGKINIYGQGRSTVINGKLIVKGPSEIGFITIQSIGTTAVTIDSNSEVTIIYTYITSTWNQYNNNSNGILLENHSGLTIVSDSILYGFVTNPLVYANFIGISGGELDLWACDVQGVVNKAVQSVTLVNARASHLLSSDDTNLKIDGGFLKLQTKVACPRVVMLNIDNVNTELFSVRTNFNSKNPGESAIIVATAAVTFKMTECSLNFKNPPSNLRMIVGVPDEFGGMPDARITSCSFVNTPIPPNEGNYEGFSFTAITTEGIITSGSLQVGTRIINDNYTITSDDAFLVVNRSKSIITFPEPQEVFPGSIASGRIILVTNISDKKIFLSTPQQLITLRSERSAIMLTDDLQWYCLGNNLHVK